MRLAQTAKLTVDPKRVLENRWVHDTAHVFLASVRRARISDRQREVRKTH